MQYSRLMRTFVYYIGGALFYVSIGAAAVNSDDRTLLLKALLGEKSASSNTHWKPDLEVIKHLIAKDKGLLETCDESSGMTILHIALIRGYDDVAKGLLAAGANIMAITTKGYNIIHLALRLTNELPYEALTNKDQREAAQTASRKVIEETIKLTKEQKKKLINQQDKSGKTPLHYFRGTKEDLEVLLGYEPDLSIQAGDGHTIFHQLALNPALIVNEKFIEYVNKVAKILPDKLSQLINSFSSGIVGLKNYTVLHTFMYDSHRLPTPTELDLFLETYKPYLHLQLFDNRFTPLAFLYNYKNKPDEIAKMYDCFLKYATKYAIPLKDILNLPMTVHNNITVLGHLQTLENLPSTVCDKIKSDGGSLVPVLPNDITPFYGNLVKPTDNRSLGNNRSISDPKSSSGGASLGSSNPQKDQSGSSVQPKGDNPIVTQNSASLMGKYGIQLGVGIAMAAGLVALIKYSLKKKAHKKPLGNDTEEGADHNRGTKDRFVIL